MCNFEDLRSLRKSIVRKIHGRVKADSTLIQQANEKMSQMKAEADTDLQKWNQMLHKKGRDQWENYRVPKAKRPQQEEEKGSSDSSSDESEGKKEKSKKEKKRKTEKKRDSHQSKDREPKRSPSDESNDSDSARGGTPSYLPPIDTKQTEGDLDLFSNARFTPDSQEKHEDKKKKVVEPGSLISDELQEMLAQPTADNFKSANDTLIINIQHILIFITMC